MPMRRKNNKPRTKAEQAVSPAPQPETPRPREGTKKKRSVPMLPYQVLFLVLLVLGSFYVSFVLNQREYLKNRNLRSLAQSARYLEASVADTLTSLETYVNEQALWAKGTDASNNGAEICDFFDKRPHLELIVPAQCQDIDLAPVSGATDSDETGDGSTVGASSRRAVLATFTREDTRVRVNVEIDPQTTTTKIVFDVDPNVIFARIPLQDVFEKLLLTDASGTVVAETGTTSLRIHSVHELQTTGTDPLDMKELTKASGLHHVRLSETTYKLFSYPLKLPRSGNYAVRYRPGKTTANKDAVEQLVMVGLVSSSAFRVESMLISPLIVLGFVTLLVFALLGLPILKIFFLSPRERFRFVDAYFLATCTLLILMVISATLFTVDIYYGLESRADETLRNLSLTMRTKLYDELDTIHQQLRGLDECAVQQRPLSSLSNLLAMHDHEVSCGQDRKELQAIVQEYPFFSKVFWTRRDGMQHVKWTTARRLTPLVDVGRRSYFQAVVDEKLMSYERPCPGACSVSDPPSDRNAAAPHPTRGVLSKLYIEPVRSLTTGEDEAVISMASRLSVNDQRTVVSLVTNLAPFTDPVLPAGFLFAVVDDDGLILFHSDRRRTLIENFFDETDHNSRLRAAVSAREPEEMNLRYRGRSYRVYVAPLVKLPWSLVLLRDKVLLRTVIIEILADVVVFLFAYLTAFVLATLVCVAVWRKRLRLLWPDRKQSRNYVHLAILYVAAIVIAMVQLGYHQEGCLVLAFLLPFMAVALAGVVLKREPLDQPESSRPRQGSRLLSKIWVASRPASYLARHCVAVLFFWILFAILPTIGMTKAAFHLEVLKRARHEQLEYSRQFAEREERIERATAALVGFDSSGPDPQAEERIRRRWLEPKLADERNIYFDTVSGTERIPERPTAKSMHRNAPFHKLLHDVVNSIKPFFNDTSVTMRNLDGATAGYAEWWRVRDDDDVDWEYFEAKPATSSALFLRTKLEPFPLLRLPTIVGLGVLLFFQWHWIRFSAGKIFFGDSLGVNPLQVSQLPLPEKSSRTIYLIPSPHERAKVKEKIQECDRQRGTENSTTSPLVDADFDTWFRDPKRRLEHLEKLERWTSQTARPVVLISRLDPSEHLREEQSDDQHRGNILDDPVVDHRWSDLLSQYRIVIVGLRPGSCDDVATAAGEKIALREDTEELLKAELGASAILHELFESRSQSREATDDLGAKQLLREIDDDARPYYQSIWNYCSQAERRTVVQLAHERLINPKQTPTIRRLLEKGLLSRDPVLRLMNESFTRFVNYEVDPVELEKLETETRGSGWNQIRIPILVLFGIVAVFLFATQKDFFDSTLGFISAASLGVPAVLRLVSFVHHGHLRQAQVV